MLSWHQPEKSRAREFASYSPFRGVLASSRGSPKKIKKGSLARTRELASPPREGQKGSKLAKGDSRELTSLPQKNHSPGSGRPPHHTWTVNVAHFFYQAATLLDQPQETS